MKTKHLLLILIILIIALVGVLSFIKPAAAPLTIDDLKNIQIPETFSTDQEGKHEIYLTNGAYEENCVYGPCISLDLDTNENSYAIADIDQDRDLDIVAHMISWTGGTGHFSYLVLYKNNQGKPEYVADKFLGDRIQINKISVENGIILADIITQGPDEPMCCGTLQKVLKFKLEGGHIDEVE